MRRTCQTMALLFTFLAFVSGSGVKSAPARDDRASDEKKAPAPDWPLFRGNALQTGIATSTLPDKLEVLWKFTAKDALGTAAIVGDRVYVGSGDGNLYALDLKTGEQKWTYKTDGFKAPVSVADGAIYVGDGDGIFHCVDAATGKKRWTFKSEGEIQSGANFTKDGVIFGSGDEHLYCVSRDGKEKWKFKMPGGPVMGTPVVMGDHTFGAGCDSKLHVIDIGTGKQKSAVELGGQTGASAAAGGDILYIGTMSGQFLAIDTKKGSVVWKFEPKDQQQFYSSPALTDKLAVIGSRDKRVYAVDRQTGKQVWSFPTKDKVDSSPVIAGQRVLVGSNDSNLYVLDLAKGRQLAKFELGGPVAASPAVGRSCIVIGTEKGVLWCLGGK